MPATGGNNIPRPHCQHPAPPQPPAATAPSHPATAHPARSDTPTPARPHHEQARNGPTPPRPRRRKSSARRSAPQTTDPRPHPAAPTPPYAGTHPATQQTPGALPWSGLPPASWQRPRSTLHAVTAAPRTQARRPSQRSLNAGRAALPCHRRHPRCRTLVEYCHGVLSYSNEQKWPVGHCPALRRPHTYGVLLRATLASQPGLDASRCTRGLVSEPTQQQVFASAAAWPTWRRRCPDSMRQLTLAVTVSSDSSCAHLWSQRHRRTSPGMASGSQRRARSRAACSHGLMRCLGLTCNA